MSTPISFGRYQLLDRIAGGGMADIFLAKATGEAGFEKLCVIKRVLPHLASAPGFREMFLDEARIAAKLNHPGIVQIFDLGRTDEDYYLAMELLLGEDLHTVLTQCQERKLWMPPSLAALVVAQAASALHYAHEHVDDAGRPLGIVHRDISPSNVFVTFQGTIKVLDFGIARAAVRQQQTSAGQVKGKLAYMAPEQASYQRVDRRADVWSLGVVLYEALALQRPFQGADTAELLNALLKEPIPRPSRCRPEIPLALEDVVMQALERDTENRYQTAQALARALDAFNATQTTGTLSTGLSDFMLQLFGEEHIRTKNARIRVQAPARGGTEPLRGAGETETAPVPPPSRPSARRRRRWWPAVALPLLAAGGIVALALRPRPPREPPPAPATAPTPPAAQRAPEAPPSPAPPAPAPPPAPKHTEPPKGWLTLAANLPATALLDGTSLGPVPLNHVHVAPGEHQLVLEGRGASARHAERITVAARGETQRRITFGKGQLNIIADPWAEVWLDGASVGQTPLALKDVWEGTHQVRLVFPSHAAKTRRLDLGPNQTLIVKERQP